MTCRTVQGSHSHSHSHISIPVSETSSTSFPCMAACRSSRHPPRMDRVLRSCTSCICHSAQYMLHLHSICARVVNEATDSLAATLRDVTGALSTCYFPLVYHAPPTSSSAHAHTRIYRVISHPIDGASVHPTLPSRRREDASGTPPLPSTCPSRTLAQDESPALQCGCPLNDA